MLPGQAPDVDHQEETVANYSSAWAAHQRPGTLVGGRAPGRGPAWRRVATLVAAGMFALLPLAPSAVAATLTLTTPYPSVTVAPGAKVSLDLTVRTDTPQRVGLAVSGVPANWTATIHGGGFLVNSVQTSVSTTDANAAAQGPTGTVRLDVTVPSTATNGTNQMTVRATGGGLTEDLPIEVRVESTVAGDLTLTTDVADRRGASSATFTFNMTLTNDTAEDLNYTASGTGPEGWTVEMSLAGQTGAASATVKAASSSSLTATVRPPTNVQAGTYPIEVTVNAGRRTVSAALNVEITGSFTMVLTTPDNRLNGRGTAGSNIDQNLVVRNDGTAELKNVTLNFTAPTGWNVTFEPASIDTIAAKGSANVVAKVAPSANAIAGDYLVTFRANSTDANATTDIRFTIETSPLWGLVGVALIVAVGAGLWWVFQRYGRR
jgi:uncharacterized membrane protein